MFYKMVVFLLLIMAASSYTITQSQGDKYFDIRYRHNKYILIQANSLTSLVTAFDLDSRSVIMTSEIAANLKGINYLTFNNDVSFCLTTSNYSLNVFFFDYGNLTITEMKSVFSERFVHTTRNTYYEGNFGRIGITDGGSLFNLVPVTDTYERYRRIDDEEIVALVGSSFFKGMIIYATEKKVVVYCRRCDVRRYIIFQSPKLRIKKVEQSQHSATINQIQLLYETGEIQFRLYSYNETPDKNITAGLSLLKSILKPTTISNPISMLIRTNSLVPNSKQIYCLVYDASTIAIMKIDLTFPNYKYEGKMIYSNNSFEGIQKVEIYRVSYDDFLQTVINFNGNKLKIWELQFSEFNVGCYPAFQFMGVVCVECGEMCEKCENAVNCGKCKANARKTGDQKCEVCTEVTCLDCESTVDQCRQCVRNYYPDSLAKCQHCQSFMTNCLKCHNQTSCQRCNVGYYVSTETDRSNCELCSVGAPFCGNCKIDRSNVVCLQCLENAIMRNGFCDQCHFSCKNCSVTTDNCSSCSMNFESDGNGGCSCLPPMLLIDNQCVTQVTTPKTLSYESIFYVNSMKNSLIFRFKFSKEFAIFFDKPLNQALQIVLNNATMNLSKASIVKDGLWLKVEVDFTETIQNGDITIIFDERVLRATNGDRLIETQKRITGVDAIFVQSEERLYVGSLADFLAASMSVSKYFVAGLSLTMGLALVLSILKATQLLPLYLVLEIQIPGNLRHILQSLLTFQLTSIYPFELELPPIAKTDTTPIKLEDFGFVSDFVQSNSLDIAFVIGVPLLHWFIAKMILRWFPNCFLTSMLQLKIRKGLYATAVTQFQGSYLLFAFSANIRIVHCLNICLSDSVSMTVSFAACFLCFAFNFAHPVCMSIIESIGKLLNQVSRTQKNPLKASIKIIKSKKNLKELFSLEDCQQDVKQKDRRKHQFFILKGFKDFFIAAFLLIMSPLQFLFTAIMIEFYSLFRILRVQTFKNNFIKALRITTAILFILYNIVFVCLYLHQQNRLFGATQIWKIGNVGLIFLLGHLLIDVIEALYNFLSLLKDILQKIVSCFSQISPQELVNSKNFQIKSSKYQQSHKISIHNPSMKKNRVMFKVNFKVQILKTKTKQRQQEFAEVSVIEPQIHVTQDSEYISKNQKKIKRSKEKQAHRNHLSIFKVKN